MPRARAGHRVTTFVDEMIYESTLEDVDTAVVPNETAFQGFVFAMVYKFCIGVTRAFVR